MEIAILAVAAILLAGQFLLFRLEQKDMADLEEFLADTSEKARADRERLKELEERLAEFERAYGTAEEFRKTIGAELEKQARLEKEWTEGVGNIIGYNMENAMGAGKS